MSAEGPKKEAPEDIDVEMKDVEVKDDKKVEVQTPSIEDIYRSLPEEYQSTQEELLEKYEVPKWSPYSYFSESRGIEATPEEQEKHQTEFLNQAMQQAIQRYNKFDPFHASTATQLERLTKAEVNQNPASMQPSIEVKKSFLDSAAARSVGVHMHNHLNPVATHIPDLAFKHNSSATDLFATKENGSRTCSSTMLLFSDKITQQLQKGHKLDDKTAQSGSELMQKVQAKQKLGQQIRNQELSFLQVASLAISDDQQGSSSSADGYTVVQSKSKRKRKK